jgi:hypothetical protein
MPIVTLSKVQSLRRPQQAAADIAVGQAQMAPALLLGGAG